MAADLVERSDSLALLARCMAAADRDGGRIALVAGEAGSGKTSLLRAFARTRQATTVWWGACDALQTPLPLAPLLDIARDRQPRIAASLGAPRARLFEAVLDELRLAAEPTLVVVEDAHWADDATLDWLKHLGRRIERTRALLAISYRDDEVGASHPLRRVLGELPVAARTLIAVPRLSPQGVETLARRAGRRADGLHAATHGNAFFVTELLRDTSEPRPAVPATVQDLVLARFARLPAGAQALLQAVSVVPGRAERSLIERVASPALPDIEAALGSGLLLAEGEAFAFRHELGRVAVESALSSPGATALHARLLGTLIERHAAPARVVHHALRCGDQVAITRFAPLAAREAAQRGAWREQGAQWRIALQHGLPTDDERIDWLDQFQRAATVVGWRDEQLQALRELQARHASRGDTEHAALNLARQFSPLISLLDHPRANAVLDDALAQLEPLAPSATHAAVWSFKSQMCMLDRDYDESIRWGRRALALAEALGDQETIERVQSSMGAALLFVDYEAGRAMLAALIERRRADGRLVLLASTLSGTIGSGAGELMRLDEAEGHLRESIAIAEAHDVDHAYASAWLSLCQMQRGRWDDAAATASDVLRRELQDQPMANLMAWVALARVRLRRGDPGIEEALDTSLRLAAASQTLQRVAPAACVRAEAAFARGDVAAVVAEVQRALPLARAKGHPWFVGELTYWLWRAGELHDAAPQGCAEPYALQIAGRWRAAADAWQALGCPYERARALAEGDEPAQREALALLEGLGARPAADALRARLHAAGLRGLARGPRASTRERPFGLTARELQMLQLLCEGLRNAEIAGRVHRSVRTVDHHLAAVFAKLGVDSRAAAVAAAQRAGLAPQTGQARGTK